MKNFTGQQSLKYKHQIRLMLNKRIKKHLYLSISILVILLLSGCGSLIKTKDKRATLLKTQNAETSELINQVNRYAQVSSMHAKIDLKFEDNSYAELGIAEKYRTAPGDVVVQRPANILLKIQLPVIGSDVVQMSSDGEKFRVAVLKDNAGGKYKNFVIGTNKADYSILQDQVRKMASEDNGKELQENVNAFSNLRPQHFTDAILMRSVDTTNFSYLQSSIVEDEVDRDAKNKSPLARVLRGYYLLDELRKNDDGSMKITRRFWFDRVGGIRLARQQIFDNNNEIESDIVYGATGNLTDTGEYNNLPLRIEVTRPKEKYKMSLTYQSPTSVTIGNTYDPEVFVLQNQWNLPEVDLDKKVQEMSNGRATPTPKIQAKSK